MAFVQKISRLILIVIASIYAIGMGETEAGILTTGQYDGVVVFDRWDGSILVNGGRVAYISEAIKELVRPYAGRSVQVDATIVVQPINPGDARIDELEILGLTTSNFADHKHLKLTAEAMIQSGDYPAFVVKVTNTGTSRVNPTLSGLAPTLLIRSDQISYSLRPGDGPSHAVITRHVLESIKPNQWTKHGMSRTNAEGVTSLHYFKWMVEDIPPDLNRVSLNPGESKKVQFLFDLPTGEYDLLFNLGLFGPAFHSHSIVSNLIAFDVLEDGNRLLIEMDR
jgi:hypothetical protein